MKIIHTSDLHLDSKIEILPSEKSKIRKDEIVRTFEKLVDYAKNNGVKAVIISGDLFDSSKVTLRTKGRVFSAINSCPETDFLYLAGNHDEEGLWANSDETPSNLKRFNNVWKTYAYGNVKISGIELDNTNAKTVYDTLNLNKDDVNIVCMHGQVAGYKSTEKAELISLPLLSDKNIDYLALGHIHSYSAGKLDNRGNFAYSGCLDGRGFDETGEKGFVLLNVEGGKVNGEFIPFSSRVLAESVFDVSNESDWYKFKNDSIAKLTADYSTSCLIKVVLTGEHTADFDLDVNGLANTLNEKFFFAKVYDKTVLKVDTKDFETDKSIRGEFVRTVLASDLEEEKKNAVIMAGLRALKGEEVL